jgi:hypothetical protein
MWLTAGAAGRQGGRTPHRWAASSCASPASPGQGAGTTVPCHTPRTPEPSRQNWRPWTWVALVASGPRARGRPRRSRERTATVAGWGRTTSLPLPTGPRTGRPRGARNGRSPCCRRSGRTPRPGRGLRAAWSPRTPRGHRPAPGGAPPRAGPPADRGRRRRVVPAGRWRGCPEASARRPRRPAGEAPWRGARPRVGSCSCRGRWAQRAGRCRQPRGCGPRLDLRGDGALLPAFPATCRCWRGRVSTGRERRGRRKSRCPRPPHGCSALVLPTRFTLPRFPDNPPLISPPPRPLITVDPVPVAALPLTVAFATVGLPFRL